MRRALQLAEKGRFTTSPNPMVGACLVKSGKLLADGYHALYGKDHAEIVALKKAGRKAKGATLFVTLEPCSSWGKTPPCTEAVIQAGVREVVIGVLDPNPENYGNGLKALKRAGLQVKVGILAKEIIQQNEWFFKYMKTGLPFVTLKMAQSLDGKIATKTGHSRWITSPPAREFVHELRLEQDAVMVGTNTLKRDNPFLSPRISVKGRETKPWRIVLDPRHETKKNARVLKGSQVTIFAVSAKKATSKGTTSQKVPPPIREVVPFAFRRILLPIREQKGRLDLKDLLKKLGALGISKILVEGGGELAWSFVEQKLADKIYWLIAPKFIGGRTAKTSLEGEGVGLASHAISVQMDRLCFLGEDLLVIGKIK